jgi:hypothetical protein
MYEHGIFFESPLYLILCNELQNKPYCVNTIHIPFVHQRGFLNTKKNCKYKVNYFKTKHEFYLYCRKTNKCVEIQFPIKLSHSSSLAFLLEREILCCTCSFHRF